MFLNLWKCDFIFMNANSFMIQIAEMLKRLSVHLAIVKTNLKLSWNYIVISCYGKLNMLWRIRFKWFSMRFQKWYTIFIIYQMSIVINFIPPRQPEWLIIACQLHLSSLQLFTFWELKWQMDSRQTRRT